MALLKMFIGGIIVYHVSSVIVAKVNIFSLLITINRQFALAQDGRIRTHMQLKKNADRNG